jgi:signal transduction histidine kinase
MPNVRKSLRLRLLAGAAIWIAGALLVAGMIIASLLRDFVERNFDERLNAQILSIMSAVSFDAAGTLQPGGVVSEPQYQQLYSGWYWQIADAETVLLKSASLWDADLGAAVGEIGQSGHVESLVGPRGKPLHALYRDFTAPGRGSNLRVTVAGPEAEIEGALGDIVPPLAISLFVLGVGLIFAVLLQILYGLRPLDALRRQIADIREGRAQRLPDAEHVELQPMVTETNSLLAHNRAVVERARNHVGNLAHGLKTPLAVLANDIAGRADSDVAADCVRTMERLVAHHLRRARSAASRNVVGVSTAIEPVIDDMTLAMSRIYADKNLTLEKTAENGLKFAGDSQDLEEILGNLIDNSCKYARNRVEIAAKKEGGDILIVIDDDGPGLDAGERERALGRGIRLDERPIGSGLGLSIVRDIAELYGGSLELAAAPSGGLRACLVLPSL